MLKKVSLLWEKNKQTLKKELKDDLWKMINDGMASASKLDYKWLIKAIIKHILNKDDEATFSFEDKEIAEIDNGCYQGTLLFLFHTTSYQPSANEYLITKVEYGSCSGCDALQSAVSFTEFNRVIDSLMSICLHICQNIKKPYRGGWMLEKWDEEMSYDYD